MSPLTRKMEQYISDAQENLREHFERLGEKRTLEILNHEEDHMLYISHREAMKYRAILDNVRERMIRDMFTYNNRNHGRR